MKASWMKPSLIRKEDVVPSRELIFPGCSGLFTIHTAFRISRYRWEKSTLWLYLQISSKDLFHSSLSIISQKNQRSLLKKRKMTITDNKIYIFTKDSSMMVLMPTNTMISFLSVLPLHLTLVKILSRHEKGKKKNSIKIGRA